MLLATDEFNTCGVVFLYSTFGAPKDKDKFKRQSAKSFSLWQIRHFEVVLLYL